MQSKYFTKKELACRCGCGFVPTQEIIDAADAIRDAWKSKVNCTSGARCMSHTIKLRAEGTPAGLASAHLEGLAVDLSPANGKIAEFHVMVAGMLDMLDLYMEHPDATPTWCHVQSRPTKQRIFRP